MCPGRGTGRRSDWFGRTEANLKLHWSAASSIRIPLTQRKCTRADLLLLAVPVEATRSTIEKFIPFLPSGCIITDAGSTKEHVVRTLEQALPPSLPCVGAHPIAGTEHAGAAAAFATLFEKRLCVLTPTERTDKTALARVRALWEGVGMRVEEMDTVTHDRVLARVSHLPHLIAFSVMNAMLDASMPGADLLTYAGSAFADLTRVAASPVEMWRDICTSNRDALFAAIEGFEKALSFMKLCVTHGDSVGLEKAINRARAERQRLTKIREQS